MNSTCTTCRPAPPTTEGVPLEHSMRALASLAGWRTVPHPDDKTVVRLALTDAKAKHDPEVGGRRELLDLVDDIEGRWLDHVL
jgi:hypothetical protein